MSALCPQMVVWSLTTSSGPRQIQRRIRPSNRRAALVLSPLPPAVSPRSRSTTAAEAWDAEGNIRGRPFESAHPMTPGCCRRLSKVRHAAEAPCTSSALGPRRAPTVEHERRRPSRSYDLTLGRPPPRDIAGSGRYLLVGHLLGIALSRR